MRTLCLCLLLCAVLGLTTAYWMEPGTLDNSYLGDDDMISSDKRSWAEGRNLCIPWRSPCTNDEELKRKYKFLKCCDNMACKCSFWGSNCRCNARLG